MDVSIDASMDKCRMDGSFSITQVSGGIVLDVNKIPLAYMRLAHKKRSGSF